MTTAWLEDSRNLCKCAFRMQQMLEHILSYK